jgi:hypothetical protein
VGFVVDKVVLGQVFSEYFDFTCNSSFDQILHTHLSSGAGTIGQLVANVPSEISLIPLHEIKKNEQTKDRSPESINALYGKKDGILSLFSLYIYNTGKTFLISVRKLIRYIHASDYKIKINC